MCHETTEPSHSTNMTRHVLIETRTEAGKVDHVCVRGIFAEHAQANAEMQRLFDRKVEELTDDGIGERDDSDANSFYINTMDIGEYIQWDICEYLTL